jgi:AraC-like DNA-binding protein
MNAVYFSGLGLVLLFVILLFFKTKKILSDRFLILFFLLVGAELTYMALESSGWLKISNWLVFLDLVYWILLGPAILLYSHFIIKANEKLHKYMLLHLLPLVIVLIPFFHYLIILPSKYDFYTFVFYKNLVYRWLIYIFWEFCSLGYFIFVVIKLIQYQKIVPDYFSSLKMKKLRWLQYLTAGFSLYIIIATIIMYLDAYHFIDSNINLQILSALFLIAYLIGIGVFGYRQEGVFSQAVLEEISNLQFQGLLSPVAEREFKYSKSGLNKEELDDLSRKLKSLMKNEKLYIKSELTIQELSKKLETSIHKVSQVINESFHENFYDFVNSYRIEEVKKLLQNTRNNNVKVISLAYDCGFNSKSAFYAAFKKSTGITPVEYRNKLQPEHNQVFTN